MISGSPKTVAIVGGGLAGLSAGCALADAGFQVSLFERRPFVGGRAYSYKDNSTGEVIDNCQHVLLGCCTNLLDFYRRIGAEQLIRWYDRLSFVEPGGRRSVIAFSSLPAPFHTATSFLNASFLGLKDKISIVRALVALMRHPLQAEDGRSFLDWLTPYHPTGPALERFWKVVLVSALNEDLDRVSARLAAMVIRFSFLRSSRGGVTGIPRVPLTELYSKAGDYIVSKGGRIELRASVSEVEPIVASCDPQSAVLASKSGARICVNGSPRMFDYAVLAVPFDGVAKLLPQCPESLRTELERFETSPISAVHFWFDRPVTELDHAILLDRTIQWMSNKSRILDGYSEGTGGGRSGNYIEVLSSASRSLMRMPRQEVIKLAVRELGDFFPVVKEATLLKAAVVKEVHATYVPSPGKDASRPEAVTSWPTLFLAGDWTATGWPSTMEGAVRSGYRAAEALCRSAGDERRFLVRDLRASGFMRMFE